MIFMHWFQTIKFMTLKRIFTFIIFSSVCLLCVSAQDNGKFDPAKFEADLEHFVAVEARLTPKESACFFPIYREMRKKQMAYFCQDKFFRHIDTSDDKACAEAISRHDENDIAMKKLQQEYHCKFMKVLSPSKVYLVIRAEEKFHRQLFKHMKPRGGKWRK